MSRGWWTLGRLRGAPIRVHWSLPLGAFFWSHFSFEPAFWLGFALVILIHELGHALVVLRYGLGLSEIALHGAGGYCRHVRSGSRFQEALVAWGGVLAQLTLYVAVQLAYSVFGPPREYHLAVLLAVFGAPNLWLAAFNLIPVEPFDGAKAWPLFGMLLARLRQRAPSAKRERASESEQRGQVIPFRRSVNDELRDLEKLDPGAETPSQRTERLVRELIARTTQPKDR